MKTIKTISIKNIITLIFVLSMLISIVGIGSLIFSSWLSSAEKMATSLSEDIGDNIYRNIYSFMHIPEQLNEENYKIIENGILDLSDEKLREKYFVGILSAQKAGIYSFSFGTAAGEYYGARRNENGTVEIMRNDSSTGGNSWYYSVSEDLTAGELVLKAGKFDPRTRAWYQAAEAAGGPAFSPIYKHFIMNDLTVSVAWPVYDASGKLYGVLGTHMLLSDIGAFLESIVAKYSGYAVIAEKGSGALVANSMGQDNFSVSEGGTFKRHEIYELQNPDIRGAYEYYISNEEPPTFRYKGENGTLFVNAREINMEGISWLVLSAIPEELYMANVNSGIGMAAILVVLAVLLSLVVYSIVTNRLLKPMSNLHRVSSALSAGDLSKRASVVRNDELGGISQSLNSVADKMQFLINNLENSVKQRTEELHKSNAALEESKNELRLILDSAAEAIYGIDLKGNCTFCNASCIKLLGYTSEKELLGKNMHWQIHHTRRDGTPFPIDECRIFRSMINGEGFTADDEVFWKADGLPFNVEYYAYPQIRNGKITGAVITFMDITERRQREDEIKYLNCHDVLTGLYNRRCFEENRVKIDIAENLPMSVIFADINGLKMTNDIFGHTAGDELIKKSAEILTQSCRESDIIARVGGDEFIILLPKTTTADGEKILQRIRAGFLTARVSAIKCSISLGLDTKISLKQTLDEVMANAENSMYKDKTINRQAINRDIINTIVETLHAKSPAEKRHSVAVRDFCGKAGAALHLPALEISKLTRSAYLHDIGKITLEEPLLFKTEIQGDEVEKMRQHSVVGYRILNLFDDMLDISEYVYSHHERWDGGGYPRGLKGEQIPLASRIISVAETYERLLNNPSLPEKGRKTAALEIIKDRAGKQFDPQIVNLFAELTESGSI